MTSKKAQELLNSLEQDKTVQNFIAQGDSRYILFNVSKSPRDFPAYTEDLDSRLNSVAMSYLSVGCSLAEAEMISDSFGPLEKGASIIETVHTPLQNRKGHSVYLNLVSSLAYYAASQYSKSFIILKKVEFHSVSARLISAFLRRDFRSLIQILNFVFLSGNYSDKTISQLENTDESTERIFTLLIAKSLVQTLEFVYSGNVRNVQDGLSTLDDLLTLTKADYEPSTWWVARLLKLILAGLQEASFWRNLPPEFGINEEMIERFIHGLAFRNPPVVELFLSQRAALRQISKGSGSVISMPTSSGKTRVAEMAILDLLSKDPEAIAIYLAPFRSLAYEIEENLELSFRPLGIGVSHLYGGGQFTKIDRNLIEDSRIIIATPEKVKAMLRSDADFMQRVKLIIIDEGHLLGPDSRFIANELFVEELKVYLERNSGRFLLLSAVLPNAKDIAHWIAGNEDARVISKWRPSTQRFGIIEFLGRNVNIEWRGNVNSYNYGFLDQFRTGTRGSDIFPSNKKQAIAATAVKLATLGSVLVFVGKTTMVTSYAKEIVTALREDPRDFDWANPNDWKAFELACNEAFGEESDVLSYARRGIVCHSARLPVDVRIYMERLMRKTPPRFIVSTPTLAQGVNIGVSTVIVANIWLDGPLRINNRDFWNIAGRAGRAFSDSEGRILFVIDRTAKQWQIDRDRQLAEAYFDQLSVENAQSGLLTILTTIKRIAHDNGIDFETLLQLVAENDYARMAMPDGHDLRSDIEHFWDRIDDTLIALDIEFGQDDGDNWIDDRFRGSLAAIQASESVEITQGEVLSLLKARVTAIRTAAGNRETWKRHLVSGLPLRSGIALGQMLERATELVRTYSSTQKGIDNLLEFLEGVETIFGSLPSREFVTSYAAADLRETRLQWMNGISLSSVSGIGKASLRMCTDYFGFRIPWAINGLAKQLVLGGLADEAKVIEEIGVLVELGLPNLLAAKIYLAGIRSRSVANELSNLLRGTGPDSSVKEVFRLLTEQYDTLRQTASQRAQLWLEIVRSGRGTQHLVERRQVPRIRELPPHGGKLYIRTHSNQPFLVSHDYSQITPIASTQIDSLGPFSDTMSSFFEFDGNAKQWAFVNKDPYA